MFHSFWKSEYSLFDADKDENKIRHLEKTENCDKLWIELFHINENEWLDEVWRQIWEEHLQFKL